MQHKLIVSLRILYTQLIGQIKISPLCLGLTSHKVKETKLLQILVMQIIGMNLLQNLFLPNRIYFLFRAILTIPAKHLRKAPIVHVTHIRMHITQHRYRIFHFRIPHGNLLVFFQFCHRLLPYLVKRFLFRKLIVQFIDYIHTKMVINNHCRFFSGILHLQR